jgi:SagB-type dehydrogenase family enzyme
VRASGGPPGRAEPGAPSRAALAGNPIPPRPDPTLSVDAAIRARRSPLGFLPDPIPAAALGFALAMAAATPALELAPGVELFAVVHRVDGVAPGLYASDGSRLAQRRAGDLRDALADACLGQDKAAVASAALFMVARPAQAAASTGPRSYRDLLIESGAIGQRIYLAAESCGLAARNLAAFLDDELDALLGFGNDGRAVLHLTLLGREDPRTAARETPRPTVAARGGGPWRR